MRGVSLDLMLGESSGWLRTKKSHLNCQCWLHANSASLPSAI